MKAVSVFVPAMVATLKMRTILTGRLIQNSLRVENNMKDVFAGNIYRNKKHGALYKCVALIVDATNERDGDQLVIYHPVDNEKEVFGRELEEFMEKFE